MPFDTTRSNTGIHSDAYTLIETALREEIFHLPDHYHMMIWMQKRPTAMSRKARYAQSVIENGCPGTGTLKVFPVIMFSWIVYESRQSRDDVMKKVMEDERLKPMMANPPFDAKRMIFGGFQPFLGL